MFARFDKMAKAFSRLGKEIVMAVKNSGPLPENNPRLRAAMQTAKGVNMPKDRIDAAIKRAISKDDKDYEEVVYEGYGPYGVAIQTFGLFLPKEMVHWEKQDRLISFSAAKEFSKLKQQVWILKSWN